MRSPGITDRVKRPALLPSGHWSPYGSSGPARLPLEGPTWYVHTWYVHGTVHRGHGSVDLKTTPMPTELLQISQETLPRSSSSDTGTHASISLVAPTISCSHGVDQLYVSTVLYLHSLPLKMCRTEYVMRLRYCTIGARTRPKSTTQSTDSDFFSLKSVEQRIFGSSDERCT